MVRLGASLFLAGLLVAGCGGSVPSPGAEPGTAGSGSPGAPSLPTETTTVAPDASSPVAEQQSASAAPTGPVPAPLVSGTSAPDASLAPVPPTSPALAPGLVGAPVAVAQGIASVDGFTLAVQWDQQPPADQAQCRVAKQRPEPGSPIRDGVVQVLVTC